MFVRKCEYCGRRILYAAGAATVSQPGQAPHFYHIQCIPEAVKQMEARKSFRADWKFPFGDKEVKNG